MPREFSDHVADEAKNINIKMNTCKLNIFNSKFFNSTTLSFFSNTTQPEMLVNHTELYGITISNDFKLVSHFFRRS